MRFGILGATEVRFDDGRPLSVGGPRARSLLALLLLDAGQVITAERLIDGLYGAAPPAGATNALQSHVSRLRQALKADSRATVEFHPAGYRLAVDLDDVDAHRFERLTREGRRSLAAGDHAGAAESLREGLALWRGPALADVRDAPFAEPQAVRLEELRLAAVEDRIEADLELGGHRDLVAELRELVEAHPLRERLRGHLMRALYGGGRQAEALAVYEDARRILAEELGADPSAELAQVHLAVLRADPALTETVRQPVRRALPGQLTSFVGRSEELARVGKLLAGVRLVTLTGPGGAGKTRLAIEAAGQAHGEVCFVDLASLAEDGEVPAAVLGALGLREAGLQLAAFDAHAPDPMARLLAALADRAMLIVLDNCEHVIEAVASTADRLLGACPALKILSTSREALGITGESLCQVPPLALPPAGASLVESLSSPAVRLFAERAAAVRPGFEPGATTAGAVVRICRALDGLPLAIELAAARLRSLEVEEVADRLDDRFRLLSRGSRTAQPRHQTLRAVVAWSWDLLDEAEQTFARRLTVFSGGMTLEAAARVSGLPDFEAVELLTSLVDKSLVDVAGQRYRMLDTIRVFCAERLAEAGEVERFREAHAAYFLALAEEAGPHLRAAEQLDWLARLGAEHDNLHGALRWAVSAREIETGLALMASLSPYWWLRGLRSEGAPLATELLAAVGPDVPAGCEEEYVLCVLSALAVVQAEGAIAGHLETAMRTTHNLPIPLRRPFLILFWGTFMGVPKDEGQVTSAAIVGHVLASTDPWSHALTSLGMAHQQLLASGEVAVAERTFAEALAGFRACGERWGMATSLIELSRFADWRGDRDRALALSDEALHLVEQLGALEDVADVVCQRGRLRLRAGDPDGAQEEYERASVLARRMALPELIVQSSVGLAEVARTRGDFAGARRLCESARAQVSPGGWNYDAVRADLLVTLGRIAAGEADLAGARAHYLDGLVAAVGSPSFPTAADAVEGMAGLALIEDDPEHAALLLGAAQALRGGPTVAGADVARDMAAIRSRLGDTAYHEAFDRGAAMSREQPLALLGVAATG